MLESAKQLKELIDQANRVVFLGGAGVSTESGIPDFRSQDGLYHQKYKFPPEEILSHSFFLRNPEGFYEFYREKILVDGVKPNRAHYALAELEGRGKLTAIVTQNIDTLHQDAGSNNVLQIHGTIATNHCRNCGTKYDLDFLRTTENVPICPHCGGIIKPDVVLYEEGLPDDVWMASVRAIQEADLLIVGGTSLVVYPAASLLNYFSHNGGNKLVLVNRDATQADQFADLICRESIGQVLEEAVFGVEGQ